MPKKVLTTNSTFFTALLDGAFAEKDTKTVTLPEVLSESFDVWVNWLYSGYSGVDYFNTYHEEDVRLWNLGDTLGCPKFQALALSFLARYMAELGGIGLGMSRHLLAFIWDACAPHSKLRKFALDQCVIDARMGGFDASNKEAIIRFAEEHNTSQRRMWQLRLRKVIVSGETCSRTLGITLQLRSPTSNISLGLEAIASLMDRIVSNQQGDREVRIIYPKSEVSSQALI